jgi:hypothetical protein
MDGSGWFDSIPPDIRNRLEKALEIGLEDSFPASDALLSARANSVTVGMT